MNLPAPCLATLQQLRQSEDNDIGPEQLFTAARAACGSDMLPILDQIEQSHNSSTGTDNDGRGMVQFLVGDAASASDIRTRPCPSLGVMDDNVFTTLGHLTQTTRLFSRIMDAMDGQEDQETEDCNPMSDITDADLAYLKLKKQFKKDGRLRMLIAASLNNTDTVYRHEASEGTMTYKSRSNQNI